MADQPVIHEPHLPHDKPIIPFFIHPSHDSIYVGGFVACCRCGVANSNPLTRKQLPISAVCVPGTHAGMRPEIGQGQRKLKTAFQNLRRLKNGRPPYNYRKWPDGSEVDVVKRVFVLNPTSEDLTARLFNPDPVDPVVAVRS